MAAMNRMSMAQQLNEQIDGESILDGILGEVANSKSAFSGVGAEVAADSLAESKRATDESRAKGLVARKNASAAVKAAFTNPDASDARDIFAIMKADETNNKAELDADREARIIKANAVAPVDVDTSAARKSNNYKRAKDAIDENNSKVVSEQDQTYLDTGKLIEEAPLGNMNSTFVEGPFTSADDMPYGKGPATTSFMSRPTTPDYLASPDSSLENNIMEVQSLLGFTGREVDGNFGKNSMRELNDFQKRAELPVTDTFTYDPATVEALKKANANIETATQGFLDKVAYGEGAKAGDETDYEIVYGQGTVDYLAPEIDGISTSPTGAPNRPLKITDMTFTQLYDYQNKMITGNTGKIRGKTAKGKGSSAAGKYQITRDSLFGEDGSAENPKANSWAAILKLDENTVFTPEIQERIGRLALRQAGFDNWLYNRNGGKSESNMLNDVAGIWASVEGSTAEQGTQTTQASLEPYLKVLRNRGVSK